MFKMILSVPVIMGCSLFGTIGMIKLIKKFYPKQFAGQTSAKEHEDK